MNRPVWRGRGTTNSYQQKRYQNEKENDPDEDNWRSQGHGQGRVARARGRGRPTWDGRGHKSHNRLSNEEPAPAAEYLKIVGTCMEMCPVGERMLREREGLLHKFEIFEEPSSSSCWPVEQSTNVGRGGRGGRRPQPRGDVHKIIKSFARSAAGQDKTLPQDLRPISVLKGTVKYLCNEILPRTDTPFNVVYDFVFDRLRAVRQDLVIQRIESKDAIHILETIVKFHIYCDFRLRDEPIANYDPHINQKHLGDCLRKLLSLYEFGNYYEGSRGEFEGLNCLVSPNSYDMISRAIAIRKIINSPILDKSIEIARSFQCKNFTRFFRKLTGLPCILQMYCVRHVSVMRGWAYEILCMSYGVNSCKIPLTWITTQLAYPSNSAAHKELGTLGIEIIREGEEKYVKFLKSQRSVITLKSAGITSTFKSSAILKVIEENSTSQLCLCF